MLRLSSCLPVNSGINFAQHFAPQSELTIILHIQYLLICSCANSPYFVSPLPLPFNIYRIHLARCQAAIYLRFPAPPHPAHTVHFSIFKFTLISIYFSPGAVPVLPLYYLCLFFTLSSRAFAKHFHFYDFGFG